MIRVEMFTGRNSDQKRAFSKAIAEAFVATCGGTLQSVQVVFADVEKSDWAVNGALCSDLVAAAPAEKQ